MRSEPPPPPRVLLGFRVALLALAIAAVVVALRVAARRDLASSEAGPGFACPMHPEVTSMHPGPCPICGMDLERLRPPEGSSARAIDRSTYLAYDVARRRGTGPDAPAPARVDEDGAIVAVLYNDEIQGLPADARAWFYAGGAPGGAILVHAVPGSITEHDRSTAEVRFRADPGGAQAASARVGRLRLIDRGRELPVVSDSAVLEGADGPYVLVATPDRRTLVQRPVRVGKTFGGLTFVLDGIGARELVVTRSAFFVDAERRQRQQAAIEVRP